MTVIHRVCVYDSEARIQMRWTHTSESRARKLFEELTRASFFDGYSQVSLVREVSGKEPVRLQSYDKITATLVDHTKGEDFAKVVAERVRRGYQAGLQ